jgi:TetR/AcrR family transcriptional regulator
VSRPRRISPERLLDAAATEFATRGFAGARVDRIAHRARVNKAMLYYYFQSKAGLYRALLERTFATANARVNEIAIAPLPPQEKIDRAIAAMADFIREHEFMPAIMLREIAEGGARLDRETLQLMSGLPRAFGRIVTEGIASGAFRSVHPVFAYINVIAPVAVYLAAAPIRRQLARLQPVQLPSLAPDDFVRHLQDAVRRALAADAPARQRRTS